MRIYRQGPRLKGRPNGNTKPGTRISLHIGTPATDFEVQIGTHAGRLVVAPSRTGQGLQSISIIQSPAQDGSRRVAQPTTASEWVRRHAQALQKFAGQWVGVTHNGIVAHSNDFDEVFQKAKLQGISNPLVFKLPKASGQPKVVSAKQG